MKLFLDSANVENIKQWRYLLDGITTNPSNLAKEGNNPTKRIIEICSLMKGKDVSVEVTEKEPKAVYVQAKQLAALHKNVVVKIPCHQAYYPIIKQLVEENIAINITLVFTLIQAFLMGKLGVRYISPFVGRWDDIDVDGVELLYEIRSMIDRYNYPTQLLAASLRHIRHFHEAIAAGADVATVPVELLTKATEHMLTDKGIEQFSNDWKKLKIKKFPE